MPANKRARGGIHLLTLALVAFGWLTASAAQDSLLRPYRVAGRDYYALDELARYSRLTYEGDGDSAILRAKALDLRFSTESSHDARETKINGYNVWLSNQIGSVPGHLLMATVDYVKTIYPLLWPQKRAGQKPIRLIVLDPGHGGNDNGAQRYGLTEKILTLDVAQRVKVKLDASRAGLTVILTRQDDTNVGLYRRPQLAQTNRADLFVSIHFNALGSGQARGIETYCLPPAGEASTAQPGTAAAHDGNAFDPENIYLAYLLHTFAVASTAMPDHGVRRARFAVLKDAPCPAALIECGFITNRTDAIQIGTEAYRDQLATGITRALLAYKAAFDPPSATTPDPTKGKN